MNISCDTCICTSSVTVTNFSKFPQHTQIENHVLDILNK